MRVVAVILAAGQGRRMGGPKALLRLGHETFLGRVTRLFARPGVSEVIAVLGYEADRVRREAGLPPGVIVTKNPGYRTGMLSSVWAGLDAAQERSATAVLLHPVDHPTVAPETVDRVVAALQKRAPIAVPSHDHRRGHPAGFAASVWPALRSVAPERGARQVLHDHPEWVVHVPGDPGAVTGVNTPLEYSKMLATST